MTGQIDIYGEIGKQVTLQSVQAELDPKFSDYILHIHSPGGDVFEGYAIYNALKNTGKKITAYVEGTCASIATLIASAADNIVMNSKSQFMVHSPRIPSMSGDARDLRNVAGQLDRIQSQLIDSWVGRTKLTREQLTEMYNNETWLTPEQAVELGFADEVREVLKAVATADIKHLHMEDNKTILQAIKDLGQTILNALNPKPKNEMMETLADGTKIRVMSDDEDWMGKQCTYEDGSPIPPGTYTLASGKEITVGENSTIAEVKEPEAVQEEKPEDKPTQEEMKALDQALARIKELESALEARNTEAAQATAKAKSFENKYTTELKEIQDKLKKIESTTVGDQTPPDLGTKKPFAQAMPIANNGLLKFLHEEVIDKRN